MAGLAEVAELVVLLKLKDEVSGGLNKINKSMQGLNASASKANASYKIGQGIGLGIRNTALIAAAGVAVLGHEVIDGLQSLEKLDAVTRQTNAVIKSTGGVAGISAEQVRALALKYEDLNAVIDDKVIQSAENVLLTFPKIGKDAFEPTLQAALNLNTALGGDESSLQQRLIVVAKAMQDPVRGLTALRRVGVAFTADQEKQIKALVKSGDALGAQRLILAELNKEFGGSFAAQGQGITGRIAAVGDAFEDLQMALAEGFLPVLNDVAAALTSALRDPATVAAIRQVGKDIAGMFTKENIQGAVRFATSIIPAITTGLKVAVGVAKTLLDAFNALPEPVKGLLVGGVVFQKLTGGLVTEGIGDLLKPLAGQFLGRGSSPANPLWVQSVGGFGGGGPGGGPDILNPGKNGPAEEGFFGSIFRQVKDHVTEIITGTATALSTAGLGTIAALAAAPVGIVGISELLAGGPEGIARGDQAGRTATAAARGLNPRNVPRGTFQGPDFAHALESARQATRQADTRPELRRVQMAATATARSVTGLRGDTRSEIAAIRGASRAQTAATRAAAIAARQTTEAVKDKDLSVSVSNRVSLSAIINGEAQRLRVTQNTQNYRER